MELFTPQQIKNLNELELLVYQYIIEHPNTVPFMRIRELAAEAHVSTTTVLHFCKKVGCDGYAQFKWKLKEQTVEQPKQDEGSNRAALRVILGIIIVALLAVILGHRRRKSSL